MRSEPASATKNVRRQRAVEGAVRAVVVEGASEVKAPRIGRPLPKYLTLTQVSLLLAAPDGRTAEGIRDRAMLELAYGAGLRVSEWIGLGVSDVQLEDLVVRVFGKGGKERLVPIGRQAAGAHLCNRREQAAEK